MLTVTTALFTANNKTNLFVGKKQGCLVKVKCTFRQFWSMIRERCKTNRSKLRFIKFLNNFSSHYKLPQQQSYFHHCV